MIIRHDVDPELYLADPSEFPAVVAVDSFQEEIPIAYDSIDRMLKPSLIPEMQMAPETCDRTDGMGTLIHPSWILTAAHVAVEISLENKIEFADGMHAIEQVVIHPGFCNWSEAVVLAKNDIALIKLVRPVDAIAPIPLYQQQAELTEIVTFLGSGDFGNGIIGPDCVDTRLRKATNCVEAIDPEWLVFKFDAPPNGTALEGISGPGDSGGPALISVKGGWAVAGISSGQDSGTLGEGRYGVLEYYTRVSHYVDWIESVVEQRLALSQSTSLHS